MKTNVNFSMFCDEFRDFGRQNNFSYDGKQVLFDYLEQLGEDTSKEYELDVIALCCEFTEYANLKEFQNDYSNEYKNLDDIAENTLVIPIDDEAFIIAQF